MKRILWLTLVLAAGCLTGRAKDDGRIDDDKDNAPAAETKQGSGVEKEEGKPDARVLENRAGVRSGRQVYADVAPHTLPRTQTLYPERAVTREAR
jgi:hypothetical protein